MPIKIIPNVLTAMPIFSNWPHMIADYGRTDTQCDLKAVFRNIQAEPKSQSIA